MKKFMFMGIALISFLSCDNDMGEFQKNSPKPTIGTYYIIGEVGQSTYTVNYENEFGVVMVENNITLPWKYEFTQDHTSLFISISGPVPHYDMIIHANRGNLGILEMICINPPCSISSSW